MNQKAYNSFAAAFLIILSTMFLVNHWLAGLGVEAGSCHRDEDCKSECPESGYCSDFRLCNCIQSILKRPEFEISEYGTESDDDKKKYTPQCTGPRCARDPDCLDCPNGKGGLCDLIHRKCCCNK